MIQIVIDTNVLVSALRSRRGSAFQLIERLGDSRWQANVSVPLLLEYEEVLKREQLRLGIPDEKIEAILGFIVKMARRPVIHFSWRPMSVDPDDDLLIDLAVAARAAWIVTYNVKHFVEVAQFGIGVATPKEFLAIIEKRL